MEGVARTSTEQVLENGPSLISGKDLLRKLLCLSSEPFLLLQAVQMRVFKREEAAVASNGTVHKHMQRCT